MNYQSDQIGAAYDKERNLVISDERHLIIIPRDEVDAFLKWASKPEEASDEIIDTVQG